MRLVQTLSIFALTLAALACGQPASTGTQAAAQPAAPAAANLSAADKAAVLRAVHLTADARGQVMNECNDRVTPRYIPADVGLGDTILFVMIGGPSLYSCYGDGPDLHLMKHEGAAYREIYGNRGGFMIILPTSHNGAHDLAFGGPGNSHPAYRYNGTVYAATNHDVPDSQVGNAPMLPAD